MTIQMKLILSLLIFCTTTLAFAQENAELKPFNLGGQDISSIWLTEYPITNEGKEINRLEPLGYFGDNYQRFYIHFISVIQNPKDKNEYFIYGKNRLKGNISEIQGTLTIEEVSVYVESDFPDYSEGIIKGSYSLLEDAKKKGTGSFQGKFETNVMIKDNKVEYSTLYWFADGFSNNQFEGTWISYLTGTKRTCNWGDYRVPAREQFDIGAGQMGVHPDYEQNGWESFELATFPIANSEEHRKRIEQAKKVEAEKWWQ